MRYHSNGESREILACGMSLHSCYKICRKNVKVVRFFGDLSVSSRCRCDSNLVVLWTKCATNVLALCGLALSCWYVKPARSGKVITIVVLYLTAFNISSTETRLFPHMILIQAITFPPPNLSLSWKQQLGNILPGMCLTRAGPSKCKRVNQYCFQLFRVVWYIY
jgi:hypothetical protein